MFLKHVRIKLFKIESAGYIVDYIFQNKLDNTKNNSINKRKFTGSYFTPYPIASYICKKTIKKFKGIKILDPCCGTGVFLSAATHLLKKSGLENNEIIKSIYAFDINEDALLIAKILISIELNLNKNESHKLWLGNNFKTIDFVFYNSNQFDFFNSNLPDNNFYNYKTSYSLIYDCCIVISTVLIITPFHILYNFLCIILVFICKIIILIN